MTSSDCVSASIRVEVCFEADDVFGEGVNVAARLGGHIRGGARGRASGPEQAGCAGRGPNPFSQDDEGPRLNPLNPTGRPPRRAFAAVGEDFRGVCGPARPTARIPPRRPRTGARRGAPGHAGLCDRTARYPQPRGLGRPSRRLPAQFRAPRRRVAGKLAGGDRDSRRRLGVAANRGDALPLDRSREGVAHGSPICGAREDPSSHRAHQSRRRGRDRSRGGYAMNAEARAPRPGHASPAAQLHLHARPQARNVPQGAGLGRRHRLRSSSRTASHPGTRQRPGECPGRSSPSRRRMTAWSGSCGSIHCARPFGLADLQAVLATEHAAAAGTDAAQDPQPRGNRADRRSPDRARPCHAPACHRRDQPGACRRRREEISSPSPLRPDRRAVLRRRASR